MISFLLLKLRSFLIRFKSSYRPVSDQADIHFFGFTLLELIIVIAIIGILAGIGVPAYYTYLEQAKITRAISEVKMLEREILLWEVDHGSLPTSLEEIGRGGLLDPWGNPYQYLNFATIKGKGKGKKRKDHNVVPINDFFDLYSMGKDGKSSSPLTANISYDDIIRAYNGRYIGLASEYT
jgi:general secretion pathway protein G